MTGKRVRKERGKRGAFLRLVEIATRHFVPLAMTKEAFAPLAIEVS
jgi:hypothetical protein